MAEQSTRAVFVGRCSKCGFEVFGFRARPAAPCAQCGATFHTSRRIAEPTANVIRQAEQDEQGYPYVR